MKQEVFQNLRRIIYRESGIVLAEEKMTLLANRIQKRLRTLGIRDEAEYVEIIQLDTSGTELIQLLDAISTNVTHFYRESQHFEILKQILRQWRSEGKRSLKIWCAAASTGQEPFTLAFEVAETLDLNSIEFKMLATDISTRALTQACRATYTNFEVAKVPQAVKSKYFDCSGDEDEMSWTVISQIAERVLFRRLNLIEIPYPLKGPIDVIFCRNVMIYFDIPTRQRIIGEFERLLAPGGYLFLSHSENLLGIQSSLARHSNSVYQKSGA